VGFLSFLPCISFQRSLAPPPWLLRPRRRPYSVFDFCETLRRLALFSIPSSVFRRRRRPRFHSAPNPVGFGSTGCCKPSIYFLRAVGSSRPGAAGSRTSPEARPAIASSALVSCFVPAGKLPVCSSVLLLPLES
jgi:hypothetical protein